MKVRDCEKCQYYRRKVYSTYHIPANYHPIGMSHAYAYCMKYGDRCLYVKNCDVRKNGMTEYVKRSLVKAEFTGNFQGEYSVGQIRAMIDCVPAAEVRENVCHCWKHLGGDEWLCPACGHVVVTEGSWEHPLTRGCKFCENCGADMRGKECETD